MLSGVGTGMGGSSLLTTLPLITYPANIFFCCGKFFFVLFCFFLFVDFGDLIHFLLVVAGVLVEEAMEQEEETDFFFTGEQATQMDAVDGLLTDVENE